MHLKKTFILAAFIAILITAFGFPASSKHKILFEKAKFTMETKGDMEGAIKLFNEIIEKYPGEREYAAKSQLYIGLCYEKSGLKEAQKAYRKVIDSYPEQTEAVRAANEKLSLLLRAEAVIRKEDKEFNIRQVWAGSDVSLDAAPSPDGRYLAFTDWQNSYGDVAIRDLATGKTRLLTNNSSLSEWASWCIMSPDGKKIAYSWYNRDEFYELRIIGIDGSQPRVLYRDKETSNIRPAEWSPDGKYILAYFKGIALVSVADGSVRVLKTLDRRRLGKMCISPDGRCIAYDLLQKEGSESHDIYLLATDGSCEIPLVEHPANDTILDWVPDGKSILFASDRMGSLSVWFIPINEGKPEVTPELVRRDMGEIQPLGFTKDGSFYYGIGGWQHDVYSAKLDLTTGKLLESPMLAINRFMGSNRSPDWSPDGKYLAYNRHGSLRICSIKTGEELELSPELDGFSRLQWFPDGRSIMVYGPDSKGRKGHYRVDVQTGDVTLILQKQQGIQSHYAWLSPDGTKIFYCSNNWSERLYQVLVRDLITGQEREIWRGTKESGSSGIAISPDGRWIALRLWLTPEYDAPTSLVVLPAGGGEMRELLRFKGNEWINEFVWTQDSKKLLFTKGIGGGPRQGHIDELWLISAKGGEPESLGLEMKRMSQVRIHPDGQRIAFTATEYKAEIWAMENFLPEEEEDKAFNIRQVWAGPGVDRLGAPSPDGRYLSYVDWDTGDLAIYELTTGKKRRLTNKGSWDESDEFALFSRWSPDGKQIVYDWFNENDFADLRIIGLDGSKPRILYSNDELEWVRTYDWSTDGTQILVLFDRKDGKKHIVLVSTADGSVRFLKTLYNYYNYYPRNMCFSPDGSYIVYDFPPEEESPESDISLLSTDGSREISLVEHPANDFVLGWAPDGKNILFASDRTGNFDAWVIRVADGKPHGAPELIKKGIGGIWPMEFTQKGSFYYGISHNNMNVYIAKLDPETGKILGPPKKAIKLFEGLNRAPNYSPDGKYLAYISTRGTLGLIRNSPRVLCIRSLETGQERELLPALDQINNPLWSPDCRSLLVRGRDNKFRRGIFQIDAQTGDFTPIVLSDENVFGSCEWSRDGKAIFYTIWDKKSNLSQIIVRDLESGTEKVLYHAPKKETLFKISLSPDGQWLALRVNSYINNIRIKFVKVMPAAGGEPRELYRFEKIGYEGHSITWTADGKYILFEGEGPRYRELFRISADGGEPQKLGLEMNRFFNLSVHPDGRHIAFSSSGSNAIPDEVWVMENFLPE